jgi:hypothetical protein
MQHSRQSAFLLGFFIFLGLSTLGYFLGSSALEYKQLERSVTVKGLSEREYPADIVIWDIKFSAVGNELNPIYERLEHDRKIITDFLQESGIQSTEITYSQPFIQDKVAQSYNNQKIPYRYLANQTLTIYSHDVETVRNQMQKLSDLGKKGVAFSMNEYDRNVQYLFTRLNDVKPEMIEEATNKAREVAQKFAKDSKSRLGKIKNARQGQFSISQRDKNNPHIIKVRVVSTVEYYLSD